MSGARSLCARLMRAGEHFQSASPYVTAPRPSSAPVCALGHLPPGEGILGASRSFPFQKTGLQTQPGLKNQVSNFARYSLSSTSPARDFSSEEGARMKAYRVYVESEQRASGGKDPAAFILCQKSDRLRRRDRVQCIRARSGGRRGRRRKFPRRDGSSGGIRCLRERRRGP